MRAFSKISKVKITYYTDNRSDERVFVFWGNEGYSLFNNGQWGFYWCLSELLTNNGLDNFRRITKKQAQKILGPAFNLIPENFNKVR